MSGNPFIRVNWVRHTLRVWFLLLDHQLAENLILVFGFYERIKKG